MKLRITQIRRKRRMSITYLSKISGVARGYISSLEQGFYDNPSVNVICKLCKALGCTPNDLIDCQNDDEGK